LTSTAALFGLSDTSAPRYTRPNYKQEGLSSEVEALTKLTLSTMRRICLPCLHPAELQGQGTPGQWSVLASLVGCPCAARSGRCCLQTQFPAPNPNLMCNTAKRDSFDVPPWTQLGRACV
jgi:hypothetical protein